MPAPSEERELVQRLLDRDKRAWHDFVCQYQDLVYWRVTHAAKQLRGDVDRTLIEDICAEVFASLLANDLASLRRFEGRSSLATWLAVIARRVCLKYLQRQPAELVCDPNTFAENSHRRTRHDSLDVLDSLIEAEDRQRLADSIERLQQSDRQILKMYYDQRLSYSEISRRMGISINTVGPKLHRAQTRLRRMLRFK